MNNNILGPDTPDSASVRMRLNEVLGDQRMQTATRVAQILYELFLAEARQQGYDSAERAWMGMDVRVIEELGREFAARICQPNGCKYILPAGTEMIVCMFGCAMIGFEELGIDVDRPGLHDIGDLPTRPGGSNLARLLRHLDDLTRDLPCRAIGMPTLVDRFTGCYPEHHLQFPAFAPAEGAVLQRDMNFASWGDFFCAYTPGMIDKVAEAIVDDMQRLWTHGPFFAPRIRSAREAATRIAVTARGVRVHAVTLDVGNKTRPGDFVAVEFEAWDHALRRGLVVQKISSHRYEKSDLDAAALDLAAVHALGADGRISVLARAIANAAPQGLTAVLADLAEHSETFVTLATRTRPLPLRLYWQHGEIGAATVGGHKIEVSPGSVTLHRETQPETIIVSLPGKPVSVVFDQPFQCAARISRVENKDGNLIVTPEPDPWLVNCRTGRMWRESTGN